MNWRAALARVRTLASALDCDRALAQARILARDHDLNFDLDSALQVATTLASVLDLDRARVLDGARVRAGALVRDLARALNSDYPLHRECALNDAAVSARALARDLDRALSSVLDRDYAPDRAASGDLDLSHALTSALASCHDLLRALASYPVLDRDRDLAAYFAHYRDVAEKLARCLDRRPAGLVTPGAAGVRSIPGRVWLAVRLMPRSWQSRTEEEFRAELAQLSSREERREYARRVLVCAWRLRRERAGMPCPPDCARVEG